MTLIWRMFCLAMLCTTAAYANDGAGDAYFLSNPDWCALDPVELEDSDTLVLDDLSIGNHAVSCSWDEALEYDAMVGETTIIAATCDDGTKTWKDDYSLSVPVVGVVAVKPVRVQRMPTTFFRCE